MCVIWEQLKTLYKTLTCKNKCCSLKTSSKHQIINGKVLPLDLIMWLLDFHENIYCNQGKLINRKEHSPRSPVQRWLTSIWNWSFTSTKLWISAAFLYSGLSVCLLFLPMYYFSWGYLSWDVCELKRTHWHWSAVHFISSKKMNANTC